MNKREAKREACFRVAMVAENALETGWIAERYPDETDKVKVSEAVSELIKELIRRGSKKSPGGEGADHA